MNKNILVVFTGGTICTTIKNGIMSTDATAPKALIELFNKSDSPCKDYVNFKSSETFNILSENMTVKKWNELIEYFQNKLPNCTEYDGIIIAHGTDTLAYSCALFSILLKGITIPVFFVSSNNSILCEDGTPNPRANGAENFRSAVECICKGINPDIYATYKNTEDGRTYLHKAEKLIQCAIYDDNFYSADAIDITDIEGAELFTVKNYSKFDHTHLPIMKMHNKKLEDCILKISPYVGLNYDMLNLQKVKAVLHGTYHSGTACVVKTSEIQSHSDEAGSILYFFDKCAQSNIPFYYSPSKTGAEHTVYASVPFIEKHTCNDQKFRIYYGQTDELMYVKLLIAYSLGFSEPEIEELMK